MDNKMICGSIGNGAEVERSLRVDWRSLLDELVYDFDDDVMELETFAEVKDYVVEGLERQISRRSSIAENVRAANHFEELDLGWWAPLIEPVEQGGGR